jgi:FKBP-type peptidyl-prolyl cis-trans isomerase
MKNWIDCSKINWIATLLLVVALTSCGGDEAPEAPTVDEVTRAELEARLIPELSPAQDRAGQQRNDIINRAIDQAYDIIPAPEGYFYEILEPGEYNLLAEGDIVTAHYRGQFLDGTIFDDSRKRGEPLRFTVGSLIEAWNLALLRVRPGGAIRILSPSNLAYGAEGLVGPRGDTLVPAHTVLEFIIDEINIHEE